MKIKNLLLACMVWGVFGCAGSSDMPLTLFPDKAVSLDSYRGKWLLINYWAIWCKPCRDEVPELNRLHQADDIELLAFNFDRAQGDALQAQAHELAIEFPLLLNDPAPLFSQKPPTGLPATLVIDPSGKFRQWLIGPQDEANVRAVLNAL